MPRIVEIKRSRQRTVPRHRDRMRPVTAQDPAKRRRIEERAAKFWQRAA